MKGHPMSDIIEIIVTVIVSIGFACGLYAMAQPHDWENTP